MSSVLNKEAIRTLYQDVERGEMTWAKANRVYEMGQTNVEMYPWGGDEAPGDWIALYTFLHPQVTETPQPPADDMRAPALRILRRLANRVIESGRPVTDMNAMVPESELSAPRDEFMRSFYSNLGSLGWTPEWSGGGKKKSQKAKFCRCIKEVRKTIRPRKGSTAEQAAIGVCVKSVLHSRGRTIKRFKCGRPSRLVTQKRK